jgi:DNA-binding Xre family transcriptional regulator
MNPFNQIIQAIKKRFPTAETTLDAPESVGGSWFLDVNLDDYSLIVEWRRKRGFGIVAGREAAYGEGADEIYRTRQSAARRILELLRSRSPTLQPLSHRLRQIRSTRLLTQEEIARRLGIQQAAVSKLESRGEAASVRTLQELFAAMGGRLSLRVSFDKGQIEELLLEDLRTGVSDRN